MQAPKKILITLNNTNISGIENFALTLVQNLNKDTHKFVIAVPDNGNIVEEFKRIGVEYFIFNNNLSNPYSIKGVFRLFLYMLENRFDIIHAQAGIVPCILGTLLMVKLRIEHKHGLDFTEDERENMKFFRRMYESAKKYFVNLTLTGCERDRLYLINKFNYNPDKVMTLYNGVTDFNVKDAERNASRPLTVGTIGRLMSQKAQEYFIEMAKSIEDMKTGLNIVYEIWGEGELYSQLNDLIKKYNLSNKVFLKGYTTDLKKTYSELDVFVLTSRYEGIPYVILKSMSAQVPVVSTDAGGINEIIRNNENGILVPLGDVEALKNSVLKILNDKKFRDYLVANAHDDYINKWTVEKTIYKMDEIYEGAV